MRKHYYEIKSAEPYVIYTDIYYLPVKLLQRPTGTEWEPLDKQKAENSSVSSP